MHFPEMCNIAHELCQDNNWLGWKDSACLEKEIRISALVCSFVVVGKEHLRWQMQSLHIASRLTNEKAS